MNAIHRILQIMQYLLEMIGVDVYGRRVLPMMGWGTSGRYLGSDCKVYEIGRMIYTTKLCLVEVFIDEGDLSSTTKWAIASLEDVEDFDPEVVRPLIDEIHVLALFS